MSEWGAQKVFGDLGPCGSGCSEGCEPAHPGSP